MTSALPAERTGEARQVFRHRATLLGPPVAILSLIGFASFAAIDPDSSVSTSAQIMTLGLVIVAPLFAAVRCRVVVHGEGVTLHRMVRTVTVPWPDIVAVSADYYGLHLHLRDGRTATAGSLGKPNWARWLGIECKADRLSALIVAEARRRAEGEPDSE